MAEEFVNFQFPKATSSIIKVIGAGGAGCNAVNHMFEEGITGVDYIICNTDAQALENSPVPVKIQLGVTLTEGRGAGNKPEMGEEAARENYEDLKKVLQDNTKMLFITAGMGGGTGTGAAPVIASLARELDILTIDHDPHVRSEGPAIEDRFPQSRVPGAQVQQDFAGRAASSAGRCLAGGQPCQPTQIAKELDSQRPATLLTPKLVFRRRECRRGRRCPQAHLAASNSDPRRHRRAYLSTLRDRLTGR